MWCRLLAGPLTCKEEEMPGPAFTHVKQVAVVVREHGEGVQHIAFGTSDPPGTLVHRDDGDPVERLAFGFVPGVDGSQLEYIYFDTVDDLGFVAEAHVIPDSWIRPDPVSTYPPT